MDMFSQGSGGAPYPASTFARSALPAPQAPDTANAGLPTVQRKQIGIIAAIFIVGAILLFHFHYEAS